MAFLDDLPLGRYVPTGSCLHRLDPRVKFALLPVLVIASFAANTPSRFGELAALALLLVCLSGLNAVLWLKGIWALRWLLLFTLGMHVVFTPGRTLWGTAWLSQDGLLHGGSVCGQLVLAMLFSSLLTLTTPPPQLAAAAGWLMSPLARFRFPLEETVALLLLALHFIPVLREEAARTTARIHEETSDSSLSRLSFVEKLVASLVFSLVERADVMAISLARGDGDAVALTRPTAFPPMGIADGLFVLAGGLSLFVFFGWLR